MKYIIMDIETDGLLDKVTKIYCLCYAEVEDNKVKIGYLTDNDSIRDYIKANKDNTFIGHNVCKYDNLVLQKLLGVKIEKLWDTLALSWYLFEEKKSHSLEEWGKILKVKKVKIDNWLSQPENDYIVRCLVDVNINTRLWFYFQKCLNDLYEHNQQRIDSICNYLSFKLNCIATQTLNPIKFNETLCKDSLAELEIMYKTSLDILNSAMGDKYAKILKTKPTKCYKQDGELTRFGEQWFQELRERNLPVSTTEIKEEPNAGSSHQLKQWLFDLGWQPDEFKQGANGEVPQIQKPFGAGLSESVKVLMQSNPELQELKSFFKIKHRIGIFKNFLNNNQNGYVIADIAGIARTLRFKHREPVVNLPKVTAFYGKQIRDMLICEPDEVIVGIDICALEDSTKQHFIYKYDTDYVQRLQQPGFDPHLDLGIDAHLVTLEESNWYKAFDKQTMHDEIDKYLDVQKRRFIAKCANFSLTYGAGPDKVAAVTKQPLSLAKRLHTVYWKKNISIKKVANSLKTKRIGKKIWIFSPVSNFWLNTKSEKDYFSTLNQSTGSFIFDCWLKFFQEKTANTPVRLQYHDELMLICKEGQEKQMVQYAKEAIQKVNKALKLNVEIKVDASIGKSYGEAH